MKSLIVPMLVEAYASGSIRTSQRDIPLLAPNYKTVLAHSVLGSRNTPGVNEKTKPLEPGIHLHFILPDAFTHSEDGNDYPAVPNRYVVTRIWRESGAGLLKAKCFVVESDFVSMDKAYSRSITIPCFSDPDDRKKWRYLGRCYPAEKMEEMEGGGEYLDKLTAIGAGDVMFAAYYPNCRSVFGFYDDLSDLPESVSADLTYFVMGYFSDPGNDPLSGVTTAGEMEEKLRTMGLAADIRGEEDVRGRVVLYGAIDVIEWKGFSHDYANIPKGKVNVVFANNSAEALSRTIRKGMDHGSPMTERMLTALQYELHDQLDKPDGNFLIDDQIHYHMFARQDSMDQNFHISADRNAVWDGEKLGGRLSDLKKEGKRIGDRKRKLVFYKETLFALWEQYVLLYEEGEDHREGYPSRQELLEEIRSTIRAVRGLEEETGRSEREYLEKTDGLQQILPEGAVCEKNGSEFFFAAKDPAVLLSGEGVKRTFAFGEDGRFTSNGTLQCQLSAVHTAMGSGEMIEKCFGRIEGCDKLPPEYADLLVQTCLVCGTVLEAVISLTGGVEAAGELPGEIALNKNPFDFATLFMIWGLDYHPTRTDGKKDNTLDGWRLEYGDTNLVYHGGMLPQQLKKYHISGQNLLTPHAVNILGNVIERYGEIYGKKEELDQIAEKVKKLSVISQSLNGFSEFFTGFWNPLQFPVMGIGGDEAEAAFVAANTGSERKSILPEQDLLPMHGGYVRITDLALVSSFGLMQPLVQESYYNGCEVDFAETVACPIKDYGLLPPSFSDFTRLNVEFAAAGDDGMLSSEAPETSPIYGIVVPEILNRRLLAYTADGVYKGMVKTVYRNHKPCARWISAPGGGGFGQMDFGNDKFRDFLKELLEGRDAFYEWNALMDRFLDAKRGTEQILWGRPLVLARAKANFEFSGYPRFQKKPEDFRKYDSCGIRDVKLPLRFGDMGRMEDGVFGYFDGDDFSGLYPAFGAENPLESEQYIRYSGEVSISGSDNDRHFTLLMEPDSPASIQTGVLPVQTIRLEAVHTKIIGELPLSAEISPLLSTETEAALPPLPQPAGAPYRWYYMEKGKYIEKNIVPPIVSFEETALMDGFIIKGGK